MIKLFPIGSLVDPEYENQVADPQALLSDGWSKLTVVERRGVLSHLHDPVDKLHAIVKLWPDRTARGDIGFQVVLLAFVGAAPDLREKVDTWIVARFGAKAASLDIMHTSSGEGRNVWLLAKAGEPHILAQIDSLAGPAAERYEAIRADHERPYALTLIDHLSNAHGEEAMHIISNLWGSRYTADLVIEDPHRIAKLTTSQQLELLSASCDATRREAIVKLFAGGQGETEIKRSCDRRVALQQRLEPVFRVLLDLH